MDSKQVRALFLDALENQGETATKEEFAEALRKVPAGEYLCGCPWIGGIVPHYCPTHHQPVVFVIREPRK